MAIRRCLPGIFGVLVMGGIAKAQDRADLLIRGGMVVDGSGSAPRAADVAIAGDRIVFVGDATAFRIEGRRTVDARGLIVAPGFIDTHTHTLGDLSSDDANLRRNVAYLAQGVTTVLTGNDGGGPVDVGARLTKFARDGIGTNAALFVGFGSVRSAVLGMSGAAATPAQVAQMSSMVRRAMEQGAVGMSAGLYYAPQSFVSTEEVIGVARAVAPYDGVYDTHLRDESSYTVGLLGAIAEALQIGRESGVAVNVSHIKALGTDVWGASDSAIATIRAARERGQRVTADQYPYTASGTSVGASLLPRWAEAGGRDSLRARLRDGSIRARIMSEMAENLRRRGGAESLLITERDSRGLAGKRLSEIAAARHADAVEVAIDIVLSGDLGVVSFNMQDDDIVRFMRAEFTMTGSDGSDGHPRKFGTFPRKYSLYVKERPVLSLAEFVHRSSQMAAVAFGLKDRGVLAKGMFADVVVFDPATFADRATYDAPERLATGVRYLLVNGQMSIDEGRVSGILAGRALRRERD